MRLVGKHIDLRLAELDDAAFILRLRLDERLNRHLSPTDDALEKQWQWLRRYKEREAAGGEYYFLAEAKSGDRCGTARIYDLRPDSFRWGSWIMSREAPATAGIESVLLLYEFGFVQLGYPRARFEVRKENHRVVAFKQRFGGRIVRSDDLYHYFHLEREDYEAARRRYARFLAVA